jgi:hypothetical protein
MRVRRGGLVDQNEVVESVIEVLRAEGQEVDEGMVRRTLRRILALQEIGLPAMELEAERANRRDRLWEVFVPYMAAGAKSWGEIEDALTDEDWQRIHDICGDSTPGEVLDL